MLVERRSGLVRTRRIVVGITAVSALLCGIGAALTGEALLAQEDGDEPAGDEAPPPGDESTLEPAPLTEPGPGSSPTSDADAGVPEAQESTPDPEADLETGVPAATGMGADAGTRESEETLPEVRASPIDAFLNGTTQANARDKAAGFFAEGAELVDPFGRFEGREAIAAHYEKLYDGVLTTTFAVKEEFVSGDETVALWTLTLTHGGLSGGDPIVVDGVSHVRFDGDKAISMRDYYDLGALVYENVTIIGRVVRWVKGKVEG